MQHPDEGTIHAWLDGALTPAEAASLQAHVAECDHCRAAVAEARGLVAASSRILLALDDAPSGATIPSAPAARSPGRPRFRANRYAAAAAVMLLGAGALVVGREGWESDGGAAAEPTVAGAPAAGTSTETAAARTDTAGARTQPYAAAGEPSGKASASGADAVPQPPSSIQAQASTAAVQAVDPAESRLRVRDAAPAAPGGAVTGGAPAPEGQARERGREAVRPGRTASALRAEDTAATAAREQDSLRDQMARVSERALVAPPRAEAAFARRGEERQQAASAALEATRGRAPAAVAGCWELEVGTWSPEVADAERPLFSVPSRIRLDTVKVREGPGAGSFTLAPAPGAVPSLHRYAFWHPVGVDSVRIVWTTGAVGVELRLRAEGPVLRGTAVPADRSGDTIPGGHRAATARGAPEHQPAVLRKAEVEARRTQCGNAER